MNKDAFQKYEIDCIREAAGQRSADVRVAKISGTHRSRTYILEGPQGSSFVKCLDAGFQNQPATLLTLDHEADGYRFFSALASGDLTLAQLHFFQAFQDGAGRELQVLGITNLEAQGVLRTLAEVYLDPDLSPGFQEAIAGVCGRAMAHLVSADFQAQLDRAAGAQSIRCQTDRLLNHPLRAKLLDGVESHTGFPWAYQNRVIGEMNVLIPRWLQHIRSKAAPQLKDSVDQVSHILTDRDLVAALAPGQSADRIIFSPCDRRLDNTLCLLEGEKVHQLFEVDLEYWGLETAGRLLGRYLAHWQMATVDRCTQPGPGELASKGLADRLYSRLAGAFCYYFIAGDGIDSAEVVLRAVSLGLAGFHAAVYWLYQAAIDVGEAQVLVSRALACLGAPDRYLRMAASAAATQESQTDQVTESVEQVLEALQPIINLAQSLSSPRGP